MNSRIFTALAASTALLLIPGLASACACGCSVFSVGAGSILPTQNGGTAWVEYDFMDQNHNWSGTSGAPAANNSDKQIRTDFLTFGGEYMFTCGWGVMVEAPVWNRTFRTDDGTGTIDTFHANTLGDIRISAVYTGLSKDMSTGLTFGLKLPSGGYQAPGFDRDTQIGTGSTDLLLGAYHVGALTRDERLTYFAKVAVEIPLATVGGYHPGQTVDGSVGVIYKAASFAGDKVSLSPVLQLIGSDRAHDTGPASDPVDSGYQRLLVSPGVELRSARWRLYADVKFPVYQQVRGNQLVAPELFTVVVSRSF